MKLELYGLLESLLEAGGKFEKGRYILLDSNGMCHREDGPAIIHPDGEHLWYRNGVLHRDDGPAVIYPNGTNYWFVNGDFIREGE